MDQAVDPLETGPTVILDQNFIDNAMRTEVQDHLFEKFSTATWPGKEEFLLDLFDRYSNASLATQKFVEGYLIPKVCSCQLPHLLR